MRKRKKRSKKRDRTTTKPNKPNTRGPGPGWGKKGEGRPPKEEGINPRGGWGGGVWRELREGIVERRVRMGEKEGREGRRGRDKVGGGNTEEGRAERGN